MPLFATVLIDYSRTIHRWRLTLPWLFYVSVANIFKWPTRRAQLHSKLSEAYARFMTFISMQCFSSSQRKFEVFSPLIAFISHSVDSGKLGLTIKRIESDLAQHELEKIGGFVDFSPDNFWGLGNRIVAIESLLNISSQMERIRPLLEKIIPENRKLFFQTFFANAVKGIVICSHSNLMIFDR